MTTLISLRLCRVCSKPCNQSPTQSKVCSACRKSVYSRFGVRGPGQRHAGPRPLPIGPTDALPGSEEKIRVIMARVEAEAVLWHPDDAKLSDAPRQVVADIDLVNTAHSPRMTRTYRVSNSRGNVQ